MKVVITGSSIQFKNPVIGQPTRAVKEHYNGRRISALVDNEEQLFRLKPDEVPFEVDEDEIVTVIKKKINEEKENDE